MKKPAPELHYITESQLTDYVRNGAVKHLRLTQTEAGTYEIVAELTWKKGDWQLVTQRGKARDWSSLDRLVRHIRREYSPAPEISLTLFYREHHKRPANPGVG